MAAVELKQLHRRFGEVVALAGIDLEIATGEFVSLLGPSGCGKTTALRLVAGFDRPTSGRVVIDGKDVTDVPPNRRDIGMVFQAYSLFPNMTAVRNVEFGLRVRKQGSTDRNRRALELLDLVGLAQAADPRALLLWAVDDQPARNAFRSSLFSDTQTPTIIETRASASGLERIHLS